MNQKMPIPELEIGDPVEFFTSQAFLWAERTRLPVNFITEAVSIVTNAFGKSWLYETFDKRRIVDGLVPPTVHELDEIFCTAGESQIVELLELAVYIKRLHRIGKFDDVIQIMKESYRTGFLQLAFAYRLSRAGVHDLAFEPDTVRGKGDIFFRHNGIPYFVECYFKRGCKVRETIDNFSKARDLISEACDTNKDAGPFRIMIKFNRSASVIECRDLGFQISRMMADRCNDRRVEIQTELADFAVDRSFALDSLDENDNPFVAKFDSPRMILDCVLTRAADVSGLRLQKSVPIRKTGRIVIWSPDCETDRKSPDEHADELIDRLSKKIKQAKAGDEHGRRIVIADVGRFDDEQRAKVILTKVQNALVPKFCNLSAIIICRRTWTTRSRYILRSFFLFGRAEVALPLSLYGQLERDEQNNDILWEYDN